MRDGMKDQFSWKIHDLVTVYTQQYAGDGLLWLGFDSIYHM